jgi:O-antigen ligase
VFLILGAASIIINATIFPDNYGRYSGYYLNPNLAGAVCAFGYCLSFGIQDKILKIIGQFVFIFAGILTFSRYFFLIWILISLISVFVDRKNAVNLGIGAGVLIVLFSVASLLSLNTSRFSALENLINNNQSSSQSAIEEDSRFDTWSQYYEMILENPITGNGYLKLSGTQFKQGVHNAYLLTLGESGVFPFFLLTGIYLYLLFQSLQFYNSHPVFIFLIISIMGFMAVAHNYFDNLIVLFMSLWLYVKMIEDKGVNLKEQLTT